MKRTHPSYPKGVDVNVPWIVTLSDFQRYIYRAIRALDGVPSRVIFFYVPPRRKHEYYGWLMLHSIESTRSQVRAALRRFAVGKVHKVKLSSLPRISDSAKA